MKTDETKTETRLEQDKSRTGLMKTDETKTETRLGQDKNEGRMDEDG